MGYLKTEVLKEPLKEHFSVSTALLLHNGFNELSYAVIDNGDRDVCIIFNNSKDKDFYQMIEKLRIAKCENLVHDFDYISDSGGFISLEKYK